MLPSNFESQRAEINRANAAHSTGPVTEAGKQAVAGNAVKHGLAGKGHAVLPGEESAFEKHLHSYLEVFAPVGAPEQDLVRNIAENYWRLTRAHAMESAHFEQMVLEESGGLDPASAQAQAWNDAAKGLQRIALYAARIQRAIEKSTARLKELQAERKIAYANAQEEAILLTRLAESSGQRFDPAAHFSATESCGGFEYSPDEIKRLILRADRLEEAKLRFLPAPPLMKGALM